jgi:hypothetical protein
MKNSVLGICGSVFLILLLPPGLHAGLVKQWQISEIAAAPVLVTGRILSVHRNERVPEDRLPWKAETWAMTADVEVLRWFTASGMPLSPQQIEVRFYAYGPNVTQFTAGDPPELPNLKSGDVRILPLRENSQPVSEPWQLMADSGVGLAIPVRADVPGDPSPSPSARTFLIHQFADTLSRGTPGEITALSGYLLWQTEDLSGDLMPLVEPGVGDDRQQWAEIAAGLDAAMGIPRPAMTELFSAKSAVAGPAGPYRGILPILQAALRKLRLSPATDELLIRTWIANAPLNSWGSANSLVEYADNPETTGTLRQALRNDLRGSSYIALVLVNHGNKAILADAVARAFRVLDDPAGFGSDLTEVQGAAALLRDHGSDRGLERLAAIVRKYQAIDEKYYRVLWQDATHSENPREVPVLAVVLADRRIALRSVRYCDLALEEFDRLTKQQFDIEDASIPERDAAIARALAWIHAH